MCSNLAAPAQGPTLAWAILYANGASDFELCLDGQCIVTTPELQVGDLLAFTDALAVLVQGSATREVATGGSARPSAIPRRRHVWVAGWGFATIHPAGVVGTRPELTAQAAT